MAGDEDSWPLLLRELLQRLHDRGERTASRAAVIAIGLTYGYKPAEIRANHALTQKDYAEAARWAREELDAIQH